MTDGEQLHPLHQTIVDAINALQDGPDRRALLATVDVHRPHHWRPERNFIVCGECAALSWPPPEQHDSMWSDVVYPCSTIDQIAAALGIPVPDYAGNERTVRRVDTLIERSGLGTAEAVLLRASVPDDVAARLVERSTQVGVAERRRPDVGRLPAAVRTELWEAFAGGHTIPYFSGPDDAHWTSGVDRLLAHLQQVGLLRVPGRTPTEHAHRDTTNRSTDVPG